MDFEIQKQIQNEAEKHFENYYNGTFDYLIDINENNENNEKKIKKENIQKYSSINVSQKREEALH